MAIKLCDVLARLLSVLWVWFVSSEELVRSPLNLYAAASHCLGEQHTWLGLGEECAGARVTAATRHLQRLIGLLSFYTSVAFHLSVCVIR